MELKKRVGQKIKELRIMSGLNQTEYAKIFGKKRGTLADIEAGRCNVGINVVVEIALHHNVTTDEILMR